MAGRRSQSSSTGSASLILSFGFLFLASSTLCSAKIFKIDPKTVDLGTREMWCAMEQQTCSLICNQPVQFDGKDNSCNATTLEYKCRCKEPNWEPQMERYEHTLPTFMCQRTYDDCVKNNLGDLTAQNNCTVTIKRFCGDLTPVPGGGDVSGILEVGDDDEEEEDSKDSTPTSSIEPTLKPKPSATPATSTAGNGNGNGTTPPPDPVKVSKDAATSSTSNNEQKEEDEGHGNPGRDTGAKVGIAVGSIGGFALIICMIYIYRLRKKTALSAVAESNNKTNRDLAEAENGLPKTGSSSDDAGAGWQLHGIGLKPELDGKALDGGKKWIVEGAVEMEQPGGIPGVPQAVYEMEVVSPVELDATGNTFELVGVVEKKSWIDYGGSGSSSSSGSAEKEVGVSRSGTGSVTASGGTSLVDGQRKGNANGSTGNKRV